ncbi:MAG: transglutaminase-like cysteine peptidase [Magnetococcales bacterium]|nr:transglutaminase-like cysteine peptidase [Magnetococcales bacterium]
MFRSLTWLFTMVLALLFLPQPLLAASSSESLLADAGSKEDPSGRADRLATVMSTHARKKPPGWEADLARIKQLPVAARIQEVQELVNTRIRTVDDPENIWLAPVDAYRNGGDCEDYAVAKLLLLKESGFSEQNLRIVVLAPLPRNQGIYHVILTARLDGVVYVLDSPGRVHGDRAVPMATYKDADRPIDWAGWSGGAVNRSGQGSNGGVHMAYGVAHGVPGGIRRVISYQQFPPNEKLVRIAADWLVIHPWEPPLTPKEVARLRLLRLYFQDPSADNALAISRFEASKLDELRRIRKSL